MRISLEWVRDYVDLPTNLSITDIARELTLKTVEVEDYVDLGASLEHVVVGRVLATEPVGDRGQVLAACDIDTEPPACWKHQ